MARLLSTSPEVPAPKTANQYIPVETPQRKVEESTFAPMSYRPDAVEDRTRAHFDTQRALPPVLVPPEPPVEP